MNVSGLLEDAALRFADHAALIEADRDGELRSVTYAELYRRVLGFVKALSDRGARKGDRIAILMDNSIELVVTESACLAAGFIWVAVNARTSAEELSAILADCEPRIFIVGHGYEQVAQEVVIPKGAEMVGQGSAVWQALFKVEAPAGFRFTKPESTTPVRIRYTSGTAGKPKGAVLTRGCYDASVDNVTSVLGELTERDTVLQVAPMTHAAGAMFLPHAAVGARAVLMRRFDVDSVLNAIENWQATAVFLVPTMLIRLVEQIGNGARLRSLKTIVYGGASMPVDRLQAAVESLGPVFVQIYGLTESTWPVCALLHEEHLRREGESQQDWRARLHSCGHPMPVGELRIVAADGHDCDCGESGEVWVRGRNTMSGYWKSETSPATPDGKGLDAEGWMHTGDVGRRDVEGFVTIIDRLHDMIVTGGFNVYPREVESALSSHPCVLESVVIGIRSPEWGETIHADVVLRADSDVSQRDLIEHCALTLPGYKKPRSVAFVDALPKNPAGKILRREVRKRLNRDILDGG